MEIIWWLAYGAIASLSVCVCAYVLLTLSRAEGRIGWRQITIWRLLCALSLLALMFISLSRAEHTALHCQREPAGMACLVLREHLWDSSRTTLPVDTLLGAEIEERFEVDAQGNPETRLRVVILTREGRQVLTRWDQGNSHHMRAEILAFLADPRQQQLETAADDRLFHYLSSPVWLALAALALIGRWDCALRGRHGPILAV